MLTRPQSRIWEIPTPLPAEMDRLLGEYPAPIRQILYNRGIRDAEQAKRYLSGQEDEFDPFILLGMDRCVDRIRKAIDAHESIVIYGDYDVDGVTATALLVQVLRALGANVRGYIPNRFDEGYGLNCEALETLAAEGVRVVVTVDCGIRSPREAEHAASRGIDLIISDHHMPKGDVPNAVAVICQKQDGDPYPNKNLAGVGLAFKIAQAMCTQYPQAGVRAEAWLDLVALGTVADIMPLTGENRSLVRKGLGILRGGGRLGVSSLAQVARLDMQRITSMDIGFILGPRLNAAGRLETALDSYHLLVAERIEDAGLLAQKLDNQNRERQDLTRDIQERAAMIAMENGAEHLLFAADPGFNEGIVGLAASKLVETYYRPAIVGARKDEYTRASCRSIPEFHITEALDQCADLLVRHGGHAAAAGFTVKNENVPELVKRLEALATEKLAGRDLQPHYRADLEMRWIDLGRAAIPEFLALLGQLQPTGSENPEALFVTRNVQVRNYKTVGKDAAHLKMELSDGNIIYPAIAFRKGEWAQKMPERLDVLYAFEVNEYMGRKELQLNIRDIRPAEQPF